MEWPLVGRDPILGRLGALAAHGSASGIEIVGEAGVGKSRLAIEVLRTAAAEGRVDDIHALNEQSAVLIRKVARSGDAPVVLTRKPRCPGRAARQLEGRRPGTGRNRATGRTGNLGPRRRVARRPAGAAHRRRAVAAFARESAVPARAVDGALEIARLAATGRTSREIAERLRISVRTVDNHLGAIYDKLGAAGRADLPALFGSAALGAIEPSGTDDGLAASGS